MLTGSEFPLRPRRFMILVQIKEVISMNKQHKQLKTKEMNDAWPDIYDHAKSIIFNLQPPKNFSKALKRHQVWRHPPMENLSKDREDRSIQKEYNQILCPWSSIFEFEGKSMETETTTGSEFLKRGNANVAQILGWKEINTSKTGIREPSEKRCLG